MASEDTPLVQGFLTEVFQTIHPKKEFAGRTLNSVGSVNTVDIDATISRVDAANSRAPSMNFNRFLTDGPGASTSDSVWAIAETNASQQMNSFVLDSGRSPKEWADQFGITEAEFNSYATRNMTEFKAFVDSKYPPGATTPGTTPGTTTTPEVNKATGVEKQSNTGGTAEERAAAAKAAQDAGIEHAKTPEGKAWWKKVLAGTSFAGLVAAVAVAAVLGKALDEYLASDGAEINFIHIKTKGGISTLIFTPKEVDVEWTGKKVGPKAGPAAKTSSIVLCVTDSVEFHNSTLVKVEEVSGGVNPTSVDDQKSKFAVDTLTGDSSGIDLTNTGYGVIHTNYDAHVASVVARAATGFGRAAGSAAKDFLSAFGGIGGVLIAVFGVIIAFMIITGIMGMMKKSNS